MIRIVVLSQCKVLQGIDWHITVFFYWIFILLHKSRFLIILIVIVSL